MAVNKRHSNKKPFLFIVHCIMCHTMYISETEMLCFSHNSPYEVVGCHLSLCVCVYESVVVSKQRVACVCGSNRRHEPFSPDTAASWSHGRIFRRERNTTPGHNASSGTSSDTVWWHENDILYIPPLLP